MLYGNRLPSASAAPISCPLPLHWSFVSHTVNAVEFQGVSKSYAIYAAPGDRLKELLSLNRLKRHKDFWALHDVSFEVARQSFCVYTAEYLWERARRTFAPARTHQGPAPTRSALLMRCSWGLSR